MRHRFSRYRDWDDPQYKEQMKEWQERRQKNKALFGIAIAILGILWIVKIVMHVYIDPEIHWPFILVIIGILTGIKHNFRNNAWWILLLIGGANLVSIYFPMSHQFIWPAALIVGGLVMAFKPRNNYCGPGWKMDKMVTSESTMNIDIVFGGRKEMITSRDFKGGTISCTFGGCELNFMQADMAESSAVLDLRVSFGGVELIVPSHWTVQNEVNPSFANVEDERVMQTATAADNRKTLILRCLLLRKHRN
jgi:predicted membrane protein